MVVHFGRAASPSIQKRDGSFITYYQNVAGPEFIKIITQDLPYQNH